jgi:1-acyl-sn-glycerol-3-phosphate acyltransferase
VAEQLVRQQPTPAPPGAADAAGDRLLDIVHVLAVELHPHRRRSLPRDLDASLDRDFGLDSLGRAELLMRLERGFRVHLPESLLTEAQTARDLVEAVLGAEAAIPAPAAAATQRPIVEAVAAVPSAARTLTEVLDWHLAQHPERPHILLSEAGAEPRTITYRALADAARNVASGLRQSGLEPGQRVAIMLPTGAAFFSAFYGTLYAGGVPVPIYPPARLSQIEEHLRRQAAILNNAEAAILITVPEALRLAALLKSQVEGLRAVDTVDGLTAPQPAVLPAIAADGLALLQYTSGSTGDPKGVMLTHGNLIANIRAMGQALDPDPASDVFISWLPLYHDLGLIGAWLGSLYYAVPVVILSPLTFLVRPQAWLWAIHRHRGTLTAAPNFGFELCWRSIDDRDIEGLDLSSLRLVVNGAEPVSAETIRRFTERFAKYGFRPEAMAPAYGLAESTVALSFPPPGRPPIIDRIRRRPLVTRGAAVPAAADEPGALAIVACGQPLPGHQIRIVDATGYEVGERQEGRLEFRGPSATSGYFRNAAKTEALFDGEWLDSGDLAYIAGGDVYITGRVKDIIIRAGRNIYPHEVEEAVGEVDGVRKGGVAVFGSTDPASGTERIVVVAETDETDPTARAALRRLADAAARDILETPADDIVLAPPLAVPKTPSGKIRRAAARALYEHGRMGAPPRALRWQLARLTLAGLVPQVRRARRVAGDLAYAVYWWAVLGLLAAVVWPLVLLVPGHRARWALVRGAARALFRLTATPLAVDGADRLPPSGAVLVANHASYLDGLVLIAALPGETAFVAKRELASQVFAGPFLRRLGTLFVERADPGASLEDARTVAAAARARRRLVFFPEGRLTRMPGLLAFHLGAFMAATEAGLPVVPVTIRGTRSVLRGGQWMPRRGALRVEVDTPLRPGGSGFSAAIELRDAARGAILARCGEPDLAGEPVSQ